MSREARRKLRSVEKERDLLRKKLIDMKTKQERQGRHDEQEKKVEQHAARLELEKERKEGQTLKKTLEVHSNGFRRSGGLACPFAEFALHPTHDAHSLFLTFILACFYCFSLPGRPSRRRRPRRHP